MNPTKLLDSLCATFSDPRLFNADYLNQKEFLRYNRLHARVCGLLGRVGMQLGFLVDFGRKYQIDPIAASNSGNPKRRSQKIAEADVSFVDSDTDEVKVLFDYETSDAPIYKMIGKFDYISCFAKHSSQVEVIGLFIAITGVLNRWRPNTVEKWRRWEVFYNKPKDEWLRETLEDRQHFAKETIPKLIADAFNRPCNKQLSLLIGVFHPDQLQLRLFHADTDHQERNVPYVAKPVLR